MDDSAIISDENIDGEAKSNDGEAKSNDEEAKAVPKIFNEKKATYKHKIFIFYLHFH